MDAESIAVRFVSQSRPKSRNPLRSQEAHTCLAIDAECPLRQKWPFPPGRIQRHGHRTSLCGKEAIRLEAVRLSPSLDLFKHELAGDTPKDVSIAAVRAQFADLLRSQRRAWLRKNPAHRNQLPVL